MTIKQAAEKYKVSPQAIYQRLKKQGVNVNSLMDKETQELTPEGEMILDKLFDKKSAPLKANSTAYAEEQKKQITALNIEISTLKEKIEGLERELAAAREDRDYLRLQLDKAQDNLTENIKRLPAPGQTVTGETKQRLSWRERITGRISSSSKG